MCPIALILAGLVFYHRAAGPTRIKKVPRNRATVVLVMDVSLSMEATDVPPNRLAGARRRRARSSPTDCTPGINLGWSPSRVPRR